MAPEAEKQRSRIWRWIPAGGLLAIALALLIGGDPFIGFVVLIPMTMAIPADTPVTRLRLGGLRWAMIGLAVGAVGVHYLTERNWGAGTIFVLLGALPVSFGFYLYRTTQHGSGRDRTRD